MNFETLVSFIPCFILSGGALVQYGISALTGIIVIYHCVQNSNSHICYAWSYQAGNKKIFSDLYVQRPQHPLISSRLHVLYASY
jgi:hypothetical protein